MTGLKGVVLVVSENWGEGGWIESAMEFSSISGVPSCML